MKKMILFMIPCLLLQSFAWAGSKDQLRAAIDEYHYGLTVGWDQKSEKALSQLNEKLAQDLQGLAAEGLTMADVRSVLAEKGKDFGLDPQTISVLADETISGDVVRQILLERSTQLYRRGSSWLPAEMIPSYLILGGLGLLFIWAIVNEATTPDDICPNPVKYDYGVPFTCEYSN